MSRILYLFTALFITLHVVQLKASERLLQVEGTAFITSEISEDVFRARAISNALQAVLQSGAQSVESFAIVENGRVLIDQIANKSNMDIAGYRVLESKSQGNKFFENVGNKFKQGTCTLLVHLNEERKTVEAYEKHSVYISHAFFSIRKP